MYLEKINGPADVKALNSPERTVLAAEMRTALIQKLSHHGGHCGPNLGLVEATIALHTVFDSPKDRFVFDVSHQTYPHKMLTGRSYGFLDPARYLLQEMQKDPKVVAITSGTPTVFGFTEDLRKQAGKQFMDVGIAEETAVALASGLAAGGAKPVYGVYSSFLQRTYDQLSQDLCINNNPATLLVFAASVYGMNDVTHLGIFDIPMISNIPNLVYLAPTTKEEYFAMLHWSMTQREHPVAIRVPACGVLSDGKAVTKDFGKLNTYEVTQAGSDVAFIGLGSFYPLAQQAAAEYEKRTGVCPTVINPYYITGLDKELLAQLGKAHKTVVTLEDGVLDGGFGQKIAAYYGGTDTKVLCYGLQKEFLDRYNVQSVLKENRLTAAQISDDLQNL